VRIPRASVVGGIGDVIPQVLPKAAP